MTESTPRYRVLVAVEDAEQRSALTMLLMPDFELTVATSAGQARALLGTEPFEVLLIDHQLQGTAVAEEASRLPGSISCLLLTEKADEVPAPEKARAQLLTLVVKPWHPARLVRLLEQSARLTVARRTL